MREDRTRTYTSLQQPCLPAVLYIGKLFRLGCWVTMTRNPGGWQSEESRIVAMKAARRMAEAAVVFGSAELYRGMADDHRCAVGLVFKRDFFADLARRTEC